jgi:hypothetical protein
VGIQEANAAAQDHARKSETLSSEAGEQDMSWRQPSAASKGAGVKPAQSSYSDDVVQSGMGAFTKNTEYNVEQIFTDLVFYLDTVANASKNYLQFDPAKLDEDNEDE